MNLDQVMNGAPEEELPKDEAATEQPTEVVEQVEEGAPSAPVAEAKHVPLAALEDERRQRQDWKEKFIRLEAETKHLREQAPPPQQPQVDPVVNLKLDMSEEMLRSEMKEATDIDETIAKFRAMAQADPSLAQAMYQSRHPWKFAYTKVKQTEAMKEIGTDPAAYRAKVEAEIRASLEKPATAPLNVPASLNGVRSSAARNAPGWTGPPPLESLFNR